MKKPVLAQPPAHRPQPQAGPVKAPRRFAFSFRFFRQMDYFGLGGASAAYFVTLLEKLQELSGKDAEKLMKDFAEKDAWRLHEINWDQKGIPVARDDFSWLDEAYRKSPDEYPFFQFQVTTGLGRVIGFWDELGVFNIVILDLNHNMQPVKKFGYRVIETTLAKGEFALATHTIDNLLKQCGESCQCRGLYGKVQNALTASMPDPAMLVAMNDDLHNRTSTLIAQGKVDCVAELLQYSVEEFEKL